MDKAKRAQTAETPKQPSLGLKLRAPYLYPDQVDAIPGGRMPTNIAKPKPQVANSDWQMK